VSKNTLCEVREAEQKVIGDSLTITIPRITDAPSIMNTRNAMAQQNLKATPCVHQQVVRNNTPGIMNAPIGPETYSLIPSRA
jgi:hypothetical protein